MFQRSSLLHYLFETDSAWKANRFYIISRVSLVLVDQFFYCRWWEKIILTSGGFGNRIREDLMMNTLTKILIERKRIAECKFISSASIARDLEKNMNIKIIFDWWNICLIRLNTIVTSLYINCAFPVSFRIEISTLNFTIDSEKLNAHVKAVVTHKIIRRISWNPNRMYIFRLSFMFTILTWERKLDCCETFSWPKWTPQRSQKFIF